MDNLNWILLSGYLFGGLWVGALLLSPEMMLRLALFLLARRKYLVTRSEMDRQHMWRLGVGPKAEKEEEDAAA